MGTLPNGAAKVPPKIEKMDTIVASIVNFIGFNLLSLSKRFDRPNDTKVSSCE